MSSGAVEYSQWLSVNEDTLFLHDGLIRVTDLVELPSDVVCTSDQDLEQEVITFDTKSPAELTNRILAVCGTENNAYSHLLEYRLNAVIGLWKAVHVSVSSLCEHALDLNRDDILNAVKKQEVLQQGKERISFLSKINLLLIYPLLRSQSKVDPGLCAYTTTLLLNCLQECPPLSLSKEPADCLNGLENLLCVWLGETCSEKSCVGNVDVNSAQIQEPKERENAASALVALACARGSMKSFIHAIHLLQKLPELSILHVSETLNKLLELQGGIKFPLSVLGSKHVICWAVEDLLSANAGSNIGAATSSGPGKDFESGRSITCDKMFLYTTNSFGVGISKVGNGLHGSLRGWVYVKNGDVGPGRLAWTNGYLLYRPHKYDEQLTNMADVINHTTLKYVRTLTRPDDQVYDEVGSKTNATTIQFCSDGKYLYWIWCPSAYDRNNYKGALIYVNIYSITNDGNELSVVRSNILLHKKDESNAKMLNESILARFHHFRPSSVAHLNIAARSVSLSGASSSSQDAPSSTSCGIPLKSLLRVPVFTCGSYIVILATVPGGGSSSNSPSVSKSSNVLATNLTFSLTDGQFVSRHDLHDASTCCLARGSPLHSLGVCYDGANNMIWMCSGDYVDQFYNPSNKAFHYVNKRLRIDTSCNVSLDARLSPADVIRMLLQHVGSTCCHQLSSEYMHSPFGLLLIQQQQDEVLDVAHFSHVLDILEIGLRTGDEKIVCCSLIILQVIFRMHAFGETDNLQQHQVLLENLKSMLWSLLACDGELELDVPAIASLLNYYDRSYYGVRAEACKAISDGVNVMYPNSQSRQNLVCSLLNEDIDQPKLYLRDLLLCNLAEQFQNLPILVSDDDCVEDVELSNDLIKSLLNVSSNETCETLGQLSLCEDKSRFDDIILNLPFCNPCVRYLCSYQNYLSKSAVLHSSSTEQSSLLISLCSLIKSYAQLVFSTSNQIVNTLCVLVRNQITSPSSDSEISVDDILQGFERVIKSSIIGYLLPSLVTCLTHDNLCCLMLAESDLMSQLVQLVVITNEISYLIMCSSSKSLTDKHLPNEIDEEYEKSFLNELKIPAPWATGKIVESIHPIRDNYKFKETVQIPGARCLYLRFDGRCSSQYDYDKLVLYAGANTSCRKVHEFGGNTHGYGSRSVLGSGWPKDQIKIEGDTVTFSFEMRSGREHNTPDKALWGFLITVRAQENTDDTYAGLPFIPDLTLMLSTLTCKLLRVLYRGNDENEDEKICDLLLQTQLLQRCLWNINEDGGITPMALPSEASLAPIISTEVAAADEKSTGWLTDKYRLSDDKLRELRLMSGQVTPQFRPSIREVIKPEVIEKNIVSTVVKHLSLYELISVEGMVAAKQHQTPLDDVSKDQSHKYLLLKSIITEVYKKTDSLVRRLQVLAELEQKWYAELEDIRNGLMPAYMSFFAMHHLLESQAKELSLLCCLKDVPFDPHNLESVVNALREKMETEASSVLNVGTRGGDVHLSVESMPKTRNIVSTILERCELLLYVTINWAQTSQLKMLSGSDKHGDLECSYGSLTGSTIFSCSRSISAPSQLGENNVYQNVGQSSNMGGHSTAQVSKKRMSLSCKQTADSLMDDILDDPRDKLPANSTHLVRLDQIYSFISKHLRNVVSCHNFLSAVNVRAKRAKKRKQALVLMKELLTASSVVGSSSHLLSAVTYILQQGPKVEELTCSGRVQEVSDAFADTMTCVVRIAAKHPISCSNGIGLLCTIPFTRSEETCLVESGLVELLDKLCSLSDYRGDSGPTSGTIDKQSVTQRVSALAWAGFQVLSNRCVMWEEQERQGATGFYDEVRKAGESCHRSGLASQVATLLTNHLARATECTGNEAAGNEALQEVLSLLNDLSRSHLGRAILSQPSCISKLLSLLVDHRPSPKLVLVILQLCRVALPLMREEDCDKVTLPKWKCNVAADSSCTGDEPSDPASKVVQLLLSKLGDFLIPGLQTLLSTRSCQVNVGSCRSIRSEVCPVSKTKGQIAESSPAIQSVDDGQENRLSVYIHKRVDQSSHEVIQPLLSGSDNRLLRLGGNTNMERIVQMDKEMSKTGKAEICTEATSSALHKAAKWAQSGLIVSTGPPVDAGITADQANQDKKYAISESVCKVKNTELAKTDPVRPFISGHVANSMSSEVIALLHSLMSSSVSNDVVCSGNVDGENSSQQFWTCAVLNVLSGALQDLPDLVKFTDCSSSSQSSLLSTMVKCKQVLATLCALGGFKETIKPGCEATITGHGIYNSKCRVMSISETRGIAVVEIIVPADSQNYPRASNTVEVPLSRLEPPRNKVTSLEKTSLYPSLISALQSILVPIDTGTTKQRSPLQLSLLHNINNSIDNNSSLSSAVCRVLADIRSRVCLVLYQHLQFDCFVSAFIKESCKAIDVLKCLAKECPQGDRMIAAEQRCQMLRMLYRDCAKPPPPIHVNDRKRREISWDPSRSYPPVRSCLFSHEMSGITFLGDPSVGAGLPRGTIVYASHPVPLQASYFYWELEICSFGDTQEDNGPVVSFGYGPAAEKRDGAWTNPVGTILFHNNGRAVHYNGSSLLQWKSVRLDVSLNPGDTAGCGWEFSGVSGVQSDNKGTVFFTYNGRRLAPVLDDVSGGMWPVVHIQKKNTRIRANFGSLRRFQYSDGRRSSAIDRCNASSEASDDVANNFPLLPFQLDVEGNDTHAASDVGGGSSSAAEADENNTPCIVPSNPKPLKEYNIENSSLYKLKLSYDKLLTIGPDSRVQMSQEDDDSDPEDEDDENKQDDHHSLLVKSWESKVFPVIRRRFRNEAERKDGLQQIRGALQLGMTDIARQTVEFLYEENGGMPRDLYLPTIEDIKEEASKFCIDSVHRGTVVVIRNPTTSNASSATGTAQLHCYVNAVSANTPSCGSATVLPRFAVHSMLKTFGLTGTVLDVDVQRELVQVETYLQSEGVLVRYWYPVDVLERPKQGSKRLALNGSQILDTSNINLHRELLQCEHILARMYCRSALLRLITFCNGPAMREDRISSTALWHGAAMASSAALLQELDVENLQLLSDHNLKVATPSGTAIEISLNTCLSPQQCLSSLSSSPTDLFYSSESRGFTSELMSAIKRAAMQGEECLIELTNQMCTSIQLAPEGFLYHEFLIGENKLCTDVHFPGSSFIIVSCKNENSSSKAKKSSTSYKTPFARVFCYNGHRVRKTGQVSRQEVVCYPRDAGNAVVNSLSSSMYVQYPTVLLPCDRVHVKCGVSPAPGVVLCLHGIPSHLPLALSFIEQLLNYKYAETNKKGASSNGSINYEGGEISASVLADDGSPATVNVLLNVVELLGGYLSRTEIPPVLKERLFHLLAEVLRTLHVTAESTHRNKTAPRHQQRLSMDGDVFFPSSINVSTQSCPSLSILTQLQTELKHLYREETKQWSPGPNGLYDHSLFSSYFHALMEVCMAVTEITTPSTFAPLPDVSITSSVVGTAAGDSSSGSFSFGSLMSSIVGDYAQAASSGLLSVALNAPPTSPSGIGKRKKLKAKRERDASSPKCLSDLGSLRNNDHELTNNGNGGASGSGLLMSKPDDSSWFRKAMSVAQILRYLVFNDFQGQPMIDKVICDGCNELSVPTAHSRLLVISGIPKYITCQQAKLAVIRSLRCCGGIYMDEVFIPSVTVSRRQPRNGNDKNGGNGKHDTSYSSTSSSGNSSHGSTTGEPTHIDGHAVVEVRLASKMSGAIASMQKNKCYFCGLSPECGLTPDELVNLCEDFEVNAVNQNLKTTDSKHQHILDEYLRSKLISQDGELTDGTLISLTEIFHSCFIAEHRLNLSDPKHESGYICLSKEQITNDVEGNLLFTFMNSSKPAKQSVQETITELLQDYGVVKCVSKKSLSEELDLATNKSKSEDKHGNVQTATSNACLQKQVSKTIKSGKRSADLTRDNIVGSKDPTSFTSGRYDDDDADSFLTLDKFMQYVLDRAYDDIVSIWLAILSCGYDIHCDRCSSIDNSQALQMSKLWTMEMDVALVHYVNSQCKKLSVTPTGLNAHEIYLTKAELCSVEYTTLQDTPVESIRLRYKLQQTLNSRLETQFLPLIDMRSSPAYRYATSALLSAARGLVFYTTKATLLNRVLNLTALRRPDQAAPEIILNPLETIGCKTKDVLKLQFCQAIRQLHNVSSGQLCVKPASGGDPTFSFNVRYTGEEVLGTSGSFRHFLSQVSKELQGTFLNLLTVCPSSSSNRNKGKFLLHPGSLTFTEEQLLIALGQLLGITIRADIPLPLDLLPVFWKVLVGVQIDCDADLQDADIVTYNYLKQLSDVMKPSNLDRILDDHQHPNFTYSTLSGDDVDLCNNGCRVDVDWSNYKEYSSSIKRLRLNELSSVERMSCVKAGLASVVDLSILSLMSPLDMEIRTCGLPDVDIEFLKAHTIYQVGLMDADPHVQFFWNALESFSQDELRKFIKFSCNQDRIPMTCPCLSSGQLSTSAQDISSNDQTDSSPMVSHVPPYPMKIAPPDVCSGLIDSRYIRVETCMFMIKLPQYSSQEVLTERLLYAINFRDDPLSG